MLSNSKYNPYKVIITDPKALLGAFIYISLLAFSCNAEPNFKHDRNVGIDRVQEDQDTDRFIDLLKETIETPERVEMTCNELGELKQRVERRGVNWNEFIDDCNGDLCSELKDETDLDELCGDL